MFDNDIPEVVQNELLCFPLEWINKKKKPLFGKLKVVSGRYVAL